MPPYSIANSSHNLINSPIIPIMENMKPIMEFAEIFQILEFKNYTESVGVWRAYKLIVNQSSLEGLQTHRKSVESGGPPNSS